MVVGQKLKLLWLQTITCNGDAHSFLNCSELESLVDSFEILYHPLLACNYSLEEILACNLVCDVLIIDGSIREEGCRRGGVEMYKVLQAYAARARYVITVGTCSTFGGLFKLYDPNAISGFCFDGEEKNSRYDKYADKLISLPGCPVHPDWIAYVLRMIEKGHEIPLDDMSRPQALYGTTVHSGCHRNEYFEWKVDAKSFGHKEGCLYYRHGCQAPYTRGSCNQIPWNGISSKTTVGTPCFGCTEPTFPKKDLFSTQTNMGIPAYTPLGVSKRAYLTLSGIAKSFRIKRFSKRIIEYDS